MGKKFSKVLGIFLALALILTAVPTAFAAVPKEMATGFTYDHTRDGKMNVTVNTTANEILKYGDVDLSALDVYAVWSATKKADNTKVEEKAIINKVAIDKDDNILADITVPKEKIDDVKIADLKDIELKLYGETDKIEKALEKVNANLGGVELDAKKVKAPKCLKDDVTKDLVFLGNAVAETKASKTFKQVYDYEYGTAKEVSDASISYNFTFVWKTLDLKKSTVTVYKRGTDERVKNAKIKFYNVKTSMEGTTLQYHFDQNKQFIKDGEVDYLGKTFKTDENGVVDLTEAIKLLKEKATTPVIAIEAESDDYKSSTVDFFSLVSELNGEYITNQNSKDGIKCTLSLFNKEDEEPFEVRVFGVTRTTPLHALKDVEVKAYTNIGEFMQEPKLGETVFAGKTDQNGVASIKDWNTVLKRVIQRNDVINDGGKSALAPKDFISYAVLTVKYGEKTETVYLTSKELGKGYVEVTFKDGMTSMFPRVAGEDRYETAVAIAKQQYKDGLKGTVILATGQNFADALTANGLTNAYQAPILLTKTNSLPESVLSYLKAEIKDGNLKNVLVLGKEGAVSSAITGKLRNELRLNVARVGGENRYETSVMVAELIKAINGGKADGTIPFAGEANAADPQRNNRDHGNQYFLANGLKFADALIASVPSARYGYPILLTDGSNMLRPETKAFFDATFKAGKIDKVLAIGGDAVITNSALAQIPGSITHRLYGKDRYETNMAANEYFKNATKVYVVTGMDYADALVAGHLAAENEAAILMVNPNGLTEEQAKWIKTNKITDYTIFGGDKAVSEKVVMEIENIVRGVK